MDKLDKALQKLSAREKEQVKKILLKLQLGNFRTLDTKKLKGRKDIYRARKGALRIIYSVGKGKKISILAIERRSKSAYRNI